MTEYLDYYTPESLKNILEDLQDSRWFDGDNSARGGYQQALEDVAARVGVVLNAEVGTQPAETEEER